MDRGSGPFTTIGFTGFPDGTFITDQYADQGVLFDGTDTFFFTPSFINDSWGVDGNGDINVAFDTPQAWISVDYPGLMQIELFSAGRLIYSSSKFLQAGVGNFAGLLSTDLFDGAVEENPYRPDRCATCGPGGTPGASGDRNSYFQLRNNVAIYGGFVGGETDLSQRDLIGNVTVLSGDISDPAVDPLCEGAKGDCFEANGTPGCDDPACCTVVCQSNAFCCEVV